MREREIKKTQKPSSKKEREKIIYDEKGEEKKPKRQLGSLGHWGQLESTRVN